MCTQDLESLLMHHDVFMSLATNNTKEGNESTLFCFIFFPDFFQKYGIK